MSHEVAHAYRPALIVLPSLGAIAGRKLARDHCSHPTCGARLRREAGVCPRCGGQIAGAMNP